ncbi:hypothetical protein WJX72_009934 [[Myrmecia] bisecta]|uniref:Uncharacterized protein n=1 Tax=[Myrmecia] bisecta TaxID=41462 RepID=A0AAW1PNG7_9CHLO
MTGYAPQGDREPAYSEEAPQNLVVGFPTQPYAQQQQGFSPRQGYLQQPFSQQGFPHQQAYPPPSYTPYTPYAPAYPPQPPPQYPLQQSSVNQGWVEAWLGHIWRSCLNGAASVGRAIVQTFDDLRGGPWSGRPS